MPVKDKERRRAINLASVYNYRTRKGSNSWWKWDTMPPDHLTPEIRRMAIQYQEKKHVNLAMERKLLAKPMQQEYASYDEYEIAKAEYDKKYHGISVKMFYCRERIKLHIKALLSLGESIPDIGLEL